MIAIEIQAENIDCCPGWGYTFFTTVVIPPAIYIFSFLIQVFLNGQIMEV